MYDGHKSEFKFNADALKEVVAPRPPTEFEIKEADATAKRNISLLESETEDIEIGKLKKRQEKLTLQSQVADLTNDQTIKKIKQQDKDKEARKQIKAENEILNKQEAYKNISPEGIETLKAQGLWDEIC